MTDSDLREQMMNLPSCTLPTVERPTRLAEFDQFFTYSVRTTARPAPTRLDLRLGEGEAEQIGRDLAARESACCSFFTFTFTPDLAGTVMRIEVPAQHVDALDTLAQRAETAIRPRR